MELSARDSTLTARKSWFMFDDEIVALGSGITSTDNRAIETIIENRRLNVASSALTVDGVAKSTTYPWSETMPNIGWAHLEATGGYIFPGGATVKGLRETRTGKWSDINTGGSTATQTNNYATLWFDHGSNPANAGYSYVLLPNQNAAQTAAYAAHSHVTILENSSAAHGAREHSLGLTAVNFWEDGEHTVGLITSDKKSAVLVRETGAQMEVSLSDPTQLNTGLITVELAREAVSAVSHDPRITILQLSPAVRFTADVNGAYGRSLKAVFALPDTSPPTIAAPEGGFTPLTLLAGVDGTAVLPDYTAQAVTSDDVGVTSVTQSPSPGATLNPGVTEVTLTAFDGDSNSASLNFDVTVLFPPIITAQPQSLTVAADRNAQFSVAAAGGAPLEYQWHHNNEPLSDSATMTGSNAPTLQLARVGVASAGDYSVTVSNADGSTTSETVALTVDTGSPSGTIVSDSFTDASATNPFGGDLLGLVWHRTSTTGSTLSVADDSSVAPPSKALFLDAASAFRGMLAFFPLQTLAAGQTITLNFDFRFTTPPSNTSQNFRFGLYNSNDTQQTGDATSATRTDDCGYGIYTNAGAASSGGTRVFVESAGDDILGGSAPGALRAVGGGGSAFDCGAEARHSATLCVTRQANGEVQLEGWLDGGTHASATITEAADQIYSFDTVALSNGGVAGSFLIDNVAVTLSGDNTAPALNPVVVTSSNASTAWARTGDTVTLSFTASEAIQPPVVTLLGASVTATNPNGNNWLATAVVNPGTPEGTAAFSITATGIFGNAATAVTSTSDASGVTVDRMAPVLDLPENITAGAMSAAGAVVNFDVGVTDNLDPNPGILIEPPSGSTFPLGDTLVNVSAADAAGNASAGSFTITVLSASDWWRVTMFGGEADDPAIAGDLVDPNHNGLVNLLEYALGGNPLVNTGVSALLPAHGKDANGHLTLSFQRFISRNDLTLTVQGAGTFDDWVDLARSTAGAAFTALEDGVNVSETGNGDTRTVTVSDRYPMATPDHPRRFLRLKVER